MGVAHLFHDGRRVALHDLQRLGSLRSESATMRLGGLDSLQIEDVRFQAGVLQPEEVDASFTERFGEDRQPRQLTEWDGQPLKVLAWNIWHGGRRKGKDEGVRRVVDVIRSSGADIVLMQETYGSGPRISARLGFDYYLRSSNLSIMSRYPIRNVHRLFSSFHFGGATIELKPGVEIQAYSLWIHYLPDVGKELEDGFTAAQIVAADQETRGSQIDSILAELLPHLDRAPAVPVIIGGDFNSGSHLDWTEQAAHLDNHMSRVVGWPVSVAMQRNGFEDSYRLAKPDPVAAPGLTWSPEFPDSHQDRIDYVYMRAGDWKVLDSKVLATHPDGWPSDHAAGLSTLELNKPLPELKVMSYNIHYGIGMDGKYDLERIAEVIQSEKPDIVGLQEISHKAMAEELGRLTDMTAVFGASKGSDDAYGDAVLSRFPLQLVHSLSLPSASSSRYQAMAVDVNLAKLYGEGHSLRFINTHFDWTDNLGSKEARRASVRVIEQGLCGDMPGLAILTGDLNAVPGSAPLLDLGEVGWHHSAFGQPIFTHGAPDPTIQIDYVLLRPKVAWKVLDSRAVDAPMASDHYPTVMRLRPVIDSPESR